MLTTGFKLWFGLFTAAVAAAVLAGYTTGGTETGPISLGWKGAVGNHIAYGTLVMAGAVFLMLALFAVAFRDADAEAAAELLGLDTAPDSQPEVGSSLWPVFAGLGAASSAVGLVVHPAVFVTGLLILVAVGVEWTMTNWSEKATGDPERNRELRENLLRPIEIPILGLVGIAVLVLAVSRVLLASSVTGAVWVATVAGVLIFGAAVFISRRPALPRGIVRSVLFVGCLAVIVAGIVTAANGEREFHHKGPSNDAHVEADH